MGLECNRVVPPGFKYFQPISYTAIAEALKNHDVDQARNLLAKWTGSNTSELGESEIARLCIEQVFICSHRQIFECNCLVLSC